MGDIYVQGAELFGMYYVILILALDVSQQF
jgi:hypothetical protein